MELAAEIQARFGAAASRYAQSDYHGSGPDLAAMLLAAELSGGERVLDVGCGAGHTALAFAPRVAEVVAIDLTEAMLDQTRALARERGLANVRCERGDAHALGFGDASFDVVTCRVCAHHFARPERAVREAARVLRRGGRFVLVDSVAPDDAAQDTFLNAVEWLRDPSHVRTHAVAQWLAWMREAGLEAAWLHTFRLDLDLEGWAARIGAPAPRVELLRSLFEGVVEEVRAGLGVRGGARAGFELPIALFRAWKPD
jgi:ubiquinone/menaquinone biosynthesis C-methylase UbiE